ncbi:MAG: hypothetical protein ACLRRT_11585 [Ruthenibacterium lactatiformans]
MDEMEQLHIIGPYEGSKAAGAHHPPAVDRDDDAAASDSTPEV